MRVFSIDSASACTYGSGNSRASFRRNYAERELPESKHVARLEAVNVGQPPVHLDGAHIDRFGKDPVKASP